MRTFLVVLALAVAALAAPQYEPIFQDYHAEVGIAEAARIKALEESLDFDGSRIAGGSNANVGQYPFMGGLVIILTNGHTSVCGSSLLTNTRSVTAAHCWRHGNSQASQFTVVLASNRLFTGGVRINTNQVEMHAQYNQGNLHNDVAIIRFNHVAFNNNIRNIGLASGTNLFVGSQADAAGFGRKGDNVGIAANQPLSHVRLTVISNAECQRTFGATFVIASTLCTSGAGGRSTCGSDSGGPLAIGNTLIGITSFGSAQGCTRGFPAAFARVSAFNDWIRARI